MPVNASNPEKLSLFTTKGHPIVCCVVLTILQLQRIVIENDRIDTIGTINTIDTINRIDCINQYKDNQYDLSDQLTLQNSPTQWHHCCFIFRFSWLIEVRIIVLLQSSIIFLLRSPLIRILRIFATQSYSGTHSRGETDLPTSNVSLLCISRSDVSYWFSTTNRTLFLCCRSYQLQQGGPDNHFKSHSIWW